jgi:small redox-active disulfide protein 2
MEIKVLGAGCSKCHSTIGIIERAAQAAGVVVQIVKVQNPDEIRQSGVSATPAVMIHGKVVHSGGLPSREEVQTWLKPGPIGFLNHPTRHLFFTGKGGVGKTSLSTATAIALADAGRRVLLVSTDAASNLDEMLGVPLSNQPVPVPGVPGLSMLNIDPDNAAEAYRQRVLAQLEATATEDERATVREQLSGACTTEIAAFDEFAALLASEGADADHTFDHVVFDTAPTGHTLRLLSLPKAWTGFLGGQRPGRLLPGAALGAEDAGGPLQRGPGGAEQPCADHRGARHPPRLVVLDTAPTGHSMLLMDATGAYHRQMTREFEGHGPSHIVTPLMRLQDAAYTKIILVTLPEVTPVSQAAALQDDLRRASIEPYAWVLNKSVLAAGTRDPLLAARLPASASRWRAWPMAWRNACSRCLG